MAAKPGMVVVDVKYDKGTQLELANQVPTLAAQLTEIRLTDQRSVDRANELISACNQWCEAVDQVMDKVRKATHEAWKAAITAQEEFKDPVRKPMAALKLAVTAFIVAAEEETARKKAAAEAEQRRKQEAADAEQRRLNAIEAKRVAEELKALGASRAEIKEAKAEIRAIAAPIVGAAPEVAPAVEASAGQSIRWLYWAEVVSMPEFIKHLASDNFLLTLFSYSKSFRDAVESELRGEAVKRKDDYAIPGTKPVKKPSGSWRG